MEPVRGQDDRERERHAMDGVWLPAGEGQSAARGLPGSRPKPKARDCQGGGLFPLGPPPSTVGGQTACVYQAEPDQTGRSRLTPFDRLRTNGE